MEKTFACVGILMPSGESRKDALLGRASLIGPCSLQPVAQLRGLSDHCPLVLMANEENWGSRPSRMLKCWKDTPDYHYFLRDKWAALQIEGCEGYVLKEKFKMIKLTLKE
ncbi:hypothetical protein TSUD_325490 [Trifolium subterraneum]|uniref:Uncharacterized protein n=1 Tax=Trifolium subterraneum TaxID=3900 RepID=A0A2Z6MJW8_TRISU|nr:hypothetical protein TSUD_325490 [Trifolium subterraneum]